MKMQKKSHELWQTKQKLQKALVFQCVSPQNVQLPKGSEQPVNLYQLNNNLKKDKYAEKY